MLMKKYSLFALMLPLLIGIGSSTWAQGAVVPGGGDASSREGTVSFSVGQIAASALSTDDYLIIEGVQQPYETFSDGPQQPTGIGGNVVSNLDIKAVPNPATYYVNLLVEGDRTETLDYHLRDIQGRSLLSGQVSGTKNRIDLNDISAGTYMLSVFKDGRLIKSFKITKPK